MVLTGLPSEPRPESKAPALSVHAIDPGLVMQQQDQADDTHEHAAREPTPEQLARLEKALHEDSLVISRIMGLQGVDFRLGKGWATDMENGVVYMDARDLINPELPDEWNEHGILHELAAHLRTLVKEPSAARREREFSKKGKAYQYFNNIVTDVKGNKLVMAMVPRMKGVTADLYQGYLFSEDDITQRPLHVQFMSAMIMQEMTPGREVTMSPEVELALAELRNFEGKGFDMIAYVTRIRKSMTEEVSALETHELAKEFILPVYERLLEIDKQNKRDGDAEYGQAGVPGQSGESAEGQGGGYSGDTTVVFSGDYAAANPCSHSDMNGEKVKPRPGSEAGKSAKKSEEAGDQDPLEEIAKGVRKAERDHKNQTPEKRNQKAIERETGRPYREYIQYNRRRDHLAGPIEEMAEFYRSIVSERSKHVRLLSGPRAEGQILDPATLAQAYADVQANNLRPLAYQEFESHEREREASGKFDIYLVLDGSGSVQSSGMAPHIADAALLTLEGLDIFAEQIAEEERTTDLDLDLDVRSAAYVFGSDVDCVKPLSPRISRKERLDVFHKVQEDQGSTGDYLALEGIDQQITAEARQGDGRKRIIFFVADGGSDDSDRLRIALASLRAKGVVVVPIGIGEAASEIRGVFGPSTHLLVSAEELPDYITSLLEAQLSS